MVFSKINRRRMFITLFTKTCHMSLCAARSIQPASSDSRSLRSVFNIALPSIPRKQSSNFFCLISLPKIYMQLFFPPILATCTTRFIHRDLTNRMIFVVEYRSMKINFIYVNISRYFLPLRPKFLLQQQIMFFPYKTPSFMPK